MAGIADDLEAFIAENSTVGCPVVRIVEKIRQTDGDETAARIQEVLENKHYASGKVLALLRRNGYKISKDSIQRHRHKGEIGGCSCK